MERDNTRGLFITGGTTSHSTIPAPVPAEPNLEQRLIETEQYVQEAHRTLDQLENVVKQTDEQAAGSGAIATAARTCRSAANLVSRLKTLHERVGGL